MWQEHKFTFTHKELVSYIKRYLASCGITEYDCWEKSYDTEDWYGYKTHWDTCRIFGLPAPYNIGHIQIDIVNTYISFRLIAKQERKLDGDEQKLYKTDVMKTADDIWIFEMADAGYAFDFEKKELKKIEQKQEWSEQDYMYLNNVLFATDSMSIWEEVDRQMHKKWLKSLRPRSHWKPSDEQMKALSIAIQGVNDPLFSLYQDLLKLKG